MLVAQGKPANHGADGRTVYEPCLLAVGGRPHVGPDGHLSGAGRCWPGDRYGIRGISTEIVVGVDPNVFAGLQLINARAASRLVQLDKVEDRRTFLRDQGRQGLLSAMRRAELERFESAYHSLVNERLDLDARRQELPGMLAALRGAVVVAQGTCYTEVRVTVRSATRLVDQTWPSVRFQRNEQLAQIEAVSLTS